MPDFTKVKLSDIARIVTGSTPTASQPDSWGTEVDFITPSDQSDSYREATPSRFLSAVGASRLHKRLVPVRSTNLTCIGSTIGKVSMAMSEAVTNQQINSIVAKDKVAHPDFIYYMIKNWSSGLKQHASGSATPIINKSDLSNYEFSVPSLVIQQAIAEVLGALDDKIAANTKLAATAGELAGRVYDQATSILPKLPMSDVLTPILGGTPIRANPDFWGGQELWASAKDITGAPFAVVTDTEEKITHSAAERTRAKPLPAGSVILTARGTVGAVARLAIPSSFNQSCYGFTPDDLSPGLLYFSILRAAEQAKSLAHGSVFDTITMRTFDHLRIPDFGDSATLFEARIAPLLDLVTTNVQENEALTKTRDAILPHLMSGKLRVKEVEEIVAAAI